MKFLWSTDQTKLGNYSVKLTNGVAQGSTIAPLLFNIYVEELSNSLKKEDITHFLFADDLIMISDLKNTIKGI